MGSSCLGEVVPAFFAVYSTFVGASVVTPVKPVLLQKPDSSSAYLLQPTPPCVIQLAHSIAFPILQHGQ